MEISKNSIYILFKILMLLDVLLCQGGKRDAKDKCPTCKDIVEAFQKGVEKTENANYGGGNTEWEERALGSYAKSETRLVEIVEGLCSDSASECHSMVEEHEETLEDWWFKFQSKDIDLKNWFCVDKLKVCCPNGTYGSDCKDCPGGKENTCNGHGQCEGDGSRKGSGKCDCDAGYEGDTCDECADDFFEEKDEDSKLKCTACHEACEGGCTGSSPKDCEKCKEGWEKSDDGECKDKDECTEEGKCESGEYCVNTPGSYTCQGCDVACVSCTGEGAKKCTECSSGYEMTDDGCTDVNECVETDKCESGKYCVNTAGSHTCEDCHESCEGDCTGEGPKGCQACKTGYTMSDEEGCKDNDECMESSTLCENGKYCVNIPASYECEACDPACVSCIGQGRQGCTKCTTGYAMSSNGCEDVDECATGANVCVKESEKCKNTVGSYKCICRSGYVRQRGKCTKKKGKQTEKSATKTEEELLQEDLEKGNYFSEAQLKIGSLLYAVFFGCLFIAFKKKQIWALVGLTLLYLCVLWYLSHSP